MAQVGIDIAAECSRLNVSVPELESTDGLAIAALARKGPKLERAAKLTVKEHALTFEAEIKARPYRELSIDLSTGQPRVENEFATQDLARLADRLRVLSVYGGWLHIDGDRITVHMDDIRHPTSGRLHARPVTSVLISMWRTLGPMLEDHDAIATRRLKRQAKKGKRFKEVAEKAVKKLQREVEATTEHLQAVVARHGDAIEARIVGEYGDKARLVVGFATTRKIVSRCDVRLMADVPHGLPSVRLGRRRAEGLFKRILSFFEEDIGHDALDEVYRANDIEAARALVSLAEAPLLEVASHAGEVVLAATTVVVKVPELSGTRGVDAAARASLELWRVLTDAGRGL